MRKESSLRVFLLLLAVMVAAAPAPGRVKAVSSVDRPVVLAFGGDVHFEGRLSGVGSLVSMAALLRADFSVVNFETSVGRGGSPEGKTYVFRAEGRHVRALVDAGVDAVAVANNHFLTMVPLRRWMVSGSLSAPVFRLPGRGSIFPGL